MRNPISQTKQMKTISQIKQMQGKAVVDSFEGIVTKVYPTKEPTPAQAEHSIHTQTLEVSGGNDGQLIYVKLLKKHFHLEQDFTGKRFRFESTKDDKDKLGGLVVSKWADKQGVTQTSVDVWGNGSMFCLDQPEEPKSHPQTEQKKVPPAMKPSAAHGHISSYMRLHYACFKVAQSQYWGESMPIPELKDIASCGAISFDRNPPKGLKEEIDAILDDTFVEAAKGAFDATEATKPTEETTEKEDWTEVKDSKGNLICEMDKSMITDMAIRMLPFHTNEKPNIKAVLNAVLLRRRQINLPYEQIYDAFDAMLQTDYSPEAIQGAYDVLSTQFKQDGEKTCLEILKDQESFRTFCVNHST